jgi:hypothetical protein
MSKARHQSAGEYGKPSGCVATSHDSWTAVKWSGVTYMGQLVRRLEQFGRRVRLHWLRLSHIRSSEAEAFVETVVALSRVPSCKPRHVTIE